MRIRCWPCDWVAIRGVVILLSRCTLLRPVGPARCAALGNYTDIPVRTNMVGEIFPLKRTPRARGTDGPARCRKARFGPAGVAAARTLDFESRHRTCGGLCRSGTDDAFAEEFGMAARRSFRSVCGYPVIAVLDLCPMQPPERRGPALKRNHSRPGGCRTLGNRTRPAGQTQ